jgi:hypothetical protein
MPPKMAETVQIGVNRDTNPMGRDPIASKAKGIADVGAFAHIDDLGSGESSISSQDNPLNNLGSGRQTS